jgi:hypothetical protein
MRGFRLRGVPSGVIEADRARFGTSAMDTVIQHSGLDLDPDLVRRYCEWFVGKEYGWKETTGDVWREGRGCEWLACLGQHLGQQLDERWRRTTLHMTCKAGLIGCKPYYWTRYVAIDLDRRPNQPPESLRERYKACVRALGTTPVVLRSPHNGVHALFALTSPLSTLGLIHSFNADWPVLISGVLRAEGLEVRPGWIEVLPTSTHTLRMPLAWGTTQLDADSLVPLRVVSRRDEIARLIASMDTACRGASLDPFALLEAYESAIQRRARPTRRVRVEVSSGAATDPNRSACPARTLDVVRLEEEGLYEGVTRNAAAMALARRKMLGLGWDGADTVEFLMQWTETKTNGRSTTAARLPCREAEATLRGEYERITAGITRGLASGKVVARIGGAVGRPITDAESRWIFDHTAEVPDPVERYRIEVFLFCATGFAKDLGRVVPGPGRFPGADVVHAQLPAKQMERWPWCGSGCYRQRVEWSGACGLTRMVANYRHSVDPKLSRARTYQLEVELDGLSGVGVDSAALLGAVEAVEHLGRTVVHPRQVEHARYALREHREALAVVYGGDAAKGIEQLAQAYARASAEIGVVAPDAA